MTNKQLNGVQVWKDVEDFVVPQLKMTVYERAVYLHLLRHSRLEGKRVIRFSIKVVAQRSYLSTFAVRKTVRRLVAKGVLRLAERSRAGHMVEVRLPEEIRGVRGAEIAAREGKRKPSETADLEKADFMERRERREAIHARDGGLCFYCLRRVTPHTRCLDHVVPQARRGRNSYRNLVSACSECNSRKGEQRAESFLRLLYREGRLGGGDLSGRLHALKDLAAGKLRPGIGGRDVKADSPQLTVHSSRIGNKTRNRMAEIGTRN